MYLLIINGNSHYKIHLVTAAECGSDEECKDITACPAEFKLYKNPSTRRNVKPCGIRARSVIISGQKLSKSNNQKSYIKYVCGFWSFRMHTMTVGFGIGSSVF